jgi:methionine synthase II (cobalamin-independent)
MSETEMTEAERRWLERKMEEEDRAEKMAEALTRWANSAGDAEIKVFATALSHKHRTLQQTVFGSFLQFAKVLAHNYSTGNCDARNEYACATAVKIMKATDDLASVPLI